MPPRLLSEFSGAGIHTIFRVLKTTCECCIFVYRNNCNGLSQKVAIFDDKAADRLHESYRKYGFLLLLLVVVALLIAFFTADPYFVLIAAGGAVFLLVAASRDLAKSMYRALNFIFGERETTITPFITLPVPAVAAVCTRSQRIAPSPD